MTSFEVTDQGYQMELSLALAGSDLLLRLTGGSHPHIGTVTSYCKETKNKEVLRFPSHSGRFHKDDVLADVILQEIVDVLPQNCVITSGVHVDAISEEQIAASFAMARRLAWQLVAWLKEHPITISKPDYY